MFYSIAVSFSGLYGILLFFQVFLDVVESVNILVNSNGQIVRSSFVLATSRHHDQQCSRIKCILISVYSSLAFYVILHTELFLAIFRF